MNRNQSQANSAAQAQADEYFDLHVKGCGYLSRVREVPVGRRGSEKFLACAISAMHGLCNDPSYSYFDLKVTGAEAEALVRDLWQAVEENRKVFVAFRAGDVYADPYEADERDRETRQPTGKKVLRASIKGRLLQITHAKIDGEVVFSSEKSDGPDQAGNAPGASSSSDEGNQHESADQSEQEGRTSNSKESEARPQRLADGRNSAPAKIAFPSQRIPNDRTRVRSFAEA